MTLITDVKLISRQNHVIHTMHLSDSDKFEIAFIFYFQYMVPSIDQNILVSCIVVKLVCNYNNVLVCADLKTVNN